MLAAFVLRAYVILFATSLLPAIQSQSISATISTEDELGIPIISGAGHGPDDKTLPGLDILKFVLLLDDGVVEANRVETPIAIRFAYYETIIFWQVLAATKMNNPRTPGLQMLDRFRKPDGAFGEPDYKLSEEELQHLYGSDAALDRYRITAMLTALKIFTDKTQPRKVFGGARFDERERFYAMLKTSSPNRTQSAFRDYTPLPVELGPLPDDFTVDVDGEDATSFGCVGGDADCSMTSPQTIGRQVAAQVLEHYCKDGWNACGKRDEVPGSFGPQLFSDTTGYHPVHEAGVSGDRRRWAPLTECNGLGYCSQQKHVTPHIGFTADTAYLSAADKASIYEEFTLEEEAQALEEAKVRAVLERTKGIAGDEEAKTLVDFFDRKNVVSNLYYAAVFDDWKMEDFIYASMGNNMLWHDGLVVNWGSKVLNDRVRPTTVMQELLGDEPISNWVEGREGEANYPASKWNAYVRVMPHAEFPSGSACICTILFKWAARLQRLLSWQQPFPFRLPHPAGSNSFEPRLPTKAFWSEYESFKAISDKCGATRLDGGMHFPESVQAGEDMCGGRLVFDKGEAFHKFLWTGNAEFLSIFGDASDFGNVADKAHKHATKCGNPETSLEPECPAVYADARGRGSGDKTSAASHSVMFMAQSTARMAVLLPLALMVHASVR